MLSRFFKKAPQQSSRSSQLRERKPQLEALERRDLMSSTNPAAGVSWTEDVYFHGHFDGAAAHMPTAADFKVDYTWGDGSTTVATDVLELDGNSDNFMAVATHTYTKAGNTPGLFEVEITNIVEPVYNWVQESFGITVNPAPTPSSETPPAQGLGLFDPQNPYNPINILTLSTPAPAANTQQPPQGQQSAPPKLQGSATQSEILPLSGNVTGNPPAITPTNLPTVHHTPPTTPKPLQPHKLVKQEPITDGTKKLIAHAAKSGIPNPSPKAISDPVIFRFGGTSHSSSLSNLQAELVKADPTTNWVPTVNALKALINKAIAKAAVAMSKEYPGQKAPATALVANGTLTSAGHGKFTLTIKFAVTGSDEQWIWANYLSAALKAVGL